MRTFFNSLISAVIGGLVVFAAVTYAVPPPAQKVREVVKRTTIAARRTPAGTLNPEDIYRRYSDAVVHVQATVTSSYDDFFGLPIPENQIAAGSGFIVSNDGYVITNAHVVQGADSVKIQFADNTEESAKVVGVDQSTDVAVLKTDVSGHKHKVLGLGDVGDVKVGQPVYAIGNPLGLDRSMSGGIISALDREIRAPNNFPIRGVMQTDAAINRGSSGGPLLSSTGKVIGVTSQIATEGSGNIGIAFAIPSSIVKKVFREIKQSGKASHPWIGIQGTTLLPEVAKELGLKVRNGAMIVSVLRAGPAQEAGLKGADRTLRLGSGNYEVGGDVIVRTNKVKIASMDDLIRQINRYRVGDELELTVVGPDNKTRVVKLRLEERPQETVIER